VETVRRLLVVLAAVLGALAVPVYRDQPWSLWLPDAVVGLAALTLAAATWRRATATCVLALVVAGTWWAGTVWPVAVYWHRGALVHLVLAAPLLWPRLRPAAAAVVLGYLVALVPWVWEQQVTVAVGVLGLGFVAVRRRLSGPGLLAVAIGVGTWLPRVVGGAYDAVAALVTYDVLVVCALLAVGLTTRVPTRTELTDLAVELGPAPLRPSALLALARQDPSLATDRDLEHALAHAGRLEAANELVRDEVRSAIAEVDASRKRLLVAAAAERARLAEELDRSTAGPLRGLTHRATEAGLVVPGLARALAGVQAAVAGLRPPVLAQGLAAAVRELPLVARLGVALDLAETRLDPVGEETLYAVVAEGLSNVAKYAGPCRASVHFAVAGGVASLVVSDDGRGGAWVGAGSGLRGLLDRVESLGGSLSVASPSGRGTVLRASVPVSATGVALRLRSEADTQAAS
jgi:signal transduction histidine kinase